MITSRLRKIAVAGVVLAASLSLLPSTAGATHQPECPYQHRADQGWLIFNAAEKPQADHNGDGLICRRVNSPGFPGNQQSKVFRDNVILGPAPTGLSISPTEHDYGSVPVERSSQKQRFVVTNFGPDAEVLDVSLTTGGPDTMFFPTSNNCLALEPNDTCSVGVVFSPTDAGVSTGQLTVTGVPDNEKVSAQLSGTGT